MQFLMSSQVELINFDPVLIFQTGIAFQITLFCQELHGIIFSRGFGLVEKKGDFIRAIFLLKTSDQRPVTSGQ